jgi:peroxin-16
MNRLKQAVGHTKDVANLPPRLLDMYSEFITKNAGAVGQVEGALRSLTYIIPGTSPTRCTHMLRFPC